MEHLARHRAARWDCASVILCSLLSPRVVLSFEFHDTRLSLSHRSPLPPLPLHLLRVFFRNRFPLGDTDEARNWIWVNSSFDHQPSLRLDGLPRLYSEQRDFHIFSSFLSFLNSNPRIFFFFLKIAEMIPMIRVKRVARLNLWRRPKGVRYREPRDLYEEFYFINIYLLVHTFFAGLYISKNYKADNFAITSSLSLFLA